jgi:hypothetical protein
VQLAHETAGAARTRSSLRPLTEEAQTKLKNSGKSLSRERERTSRRPRERGEDDENFQNPGPHCHKSFT